MTSVFANQQDRYHATASAGSYCLNREIRPSRAFKSHRLLAKPTYPGTVDAGIQIANPANNNTDDTLP
jgi:hypothetical protein